jgi:hypothetical protein
MGDLSVLVTQLKKIANACKGRPNAELFSLELP